MKPEIKTLSPQTPLLFWLRLNGEVEYCHVTDIQDSKFPVALEVAFGYFEEEGGLTKHSWPRVPLGDIEYWVMKNGKLIHRFVALCPALECIDDDKDAIKVAAVRPLLT